MSLIPQLPLKRLQKMTPEELRKLASVELIDEEGVYIATLLIPPEQGGMTIYDEIKINAESLGMRSNIVVPPSALEMVNEVPMERYPNLAKAREVKKANRELANAV